MKSLDKYVVFSITILLVYTVVTMVITYKTGYENATLTTCFFACFGGEILTAGLIKIFKLKNSSDEEENGE